MFLNVGGTTFETRRSTLGKASCFFSEFATFENEDCIVFIDRDPTHFRHILNFLRGTVTCPSTTIEIEELMKEAEFYALDQLVKTLKHRISCNIHDYCFHLHNISSRLPS